MCLAVGTGFCRLAPKCMRAHASTHAACRTHACRLWCRVWGGTLAFTLSGG